MKNRIIKINKKEILLLIIMWVTTFTLLISLCICRETKKEVDNMFQKFGRSFTVEVMEYEDMFEYLWNQRTISESYLYKGPIIDEKIVTKIMKVDGISDICKESKVSVMFEEIEFVPGLSGGNYEIIKQEGEKGYGIDLSSGYEPGDAFPHNMLHGYNNTELIPYFRTNMFELTEGNHLKEKDNNKVIISEKLAQLNHLEIGDKIEAEIKLYSRDTRSASDLIKEYSLEVAGIFKVNAKQNMNGYPLREDIVDNYIFANIDTVQMIDQDMRNAIGYEGETLYTYTEFFVETPAMLEEVITAVEQIVEIDSIYYKIEADHIPYEAVLKPMQKINKIAYIFIIYMVLAGLAISILFYKIEITTLFRIQRNKGNVLKHVIAKTIITLFISIIISTSIALNVSSKIGNYVYEKVQVIENIEDTENNITEIIPIPETFEERQEYFEQFVLDNNIDKIRSINCEITWGDLVYCIVIVFITQCIAVGVGIKLSMRKISLQK